MAFLSWIKSKFGTKKQTASQDQAAECIERLKGVDEILRKLQKRDRRQGQLLELMHQEFSTKLDSISNRIDTGIPYDSVYDFASNFALFFIQHHDQSSTEKSIWSKFVDMLKNMDMELILDLYSPFDDTRHSVCDTRFDPAQPEGIILEVVQPGLLIQGRLKKFAVVVINRQPDNR